MGGFQQRRLKRPDRKSSGFEVYERDPVLELSDARRSFVRNTGGKLRNVKTATKYQGLSAAEKKRYKELNPQDFEEEFKLSKKTLLGG